MALNDAGYLILANSYIYTAPVGTEAPAPGSLATPGAPWSILGHLGTEEGDGGPEWERDGGDVSTKGSLSKKSIRTVTEAITESLVFSISQFDREVLKVFTGADGGTTTGVFDVDGESIGQGVERAVLLTIRDGATWVGFHALKASLTAADTLSATDVENAVLFPLRATLLDNEVGDPRYSWISPTLLEIPTP